MVRCMVKTRQSMETYALCIFYIQVKWKKVERERVPFRPPFTIHIYFCTFRHVKIRNVHNECVMWMHAGMYVCIYVCMRTQLINLSHQFLGGT